MSVRNAPRAAPVTRGRLAVAVLTGVLLLAAGVLLLPSSPDNDVGTVPPLSSSPLPTGAGLGSPAAPTPDSVAPSAPPSTRPTRPPSGRPSLRPTAQPFAPVRVQVLGAAINARVVPVGVGEDGMLGVPEDVRRVGWWRSGAAAGASSGTVVLVGHVDSAKQGPGAFFPLRRLKPGDRVVLTAGSGERTMYVVSARRQYPKSSLPRTEVFGQGSRHRLVLLTCGGRFDAVTRHYEDNVVVYATPLGKEG